MTTCTDREAKRALEALFLGELDAEGHSRLRAHVAGCAGCREAYDRLGRVESALEGRALPRGRQALLEKELLARVEAGSRARALPSRRFVPSYFLPAALGLVACAMLLVVVVPRLGLDPEEPEWRARGAEAGSAWGVRAFCVAMDGGVRAEARPGGTLACAEGGSVQFSYTAPEAARLQVVGSSASGEPLQFFPREGEGAEVSPGVDVPLPFSTPVQQGWLSSPVEVRARFTDVGGRLLSETRVTLTLE